MQEIQEKIEALAVTDDQVQARDPEIDWLHNKVIGKKIKVVLTDDREIIGTLQCADHLANLVMINAIENINPTISRTLGSVIVPAKGLKRIFLSNM